MVSQIKVNEIIKQSGSSITIGESGDTITLPSTATLSNFPSNTPYFQATLSANQTLSDNTLAKAAFDEELFFFFIKICLPKSMILHTTGSAPEGDT